MRANWPSAPVNQDLRFILQQLRDSVEDLQTKLAVHIQAEGAPMSEACVKKIGEYAEASIALRARCERLAAVASAVSSVAVSVMPPGFKKVSSAQASAAWYLRSDVAEDQGNLFDTGLFRRIAESLGNLQPNDLGEPTEKGVR